MPIVPGKTSQPFGPDEPDSIYSQSMDKAPVQRQPAPAVDNLESIYDNPTDTSRLSVARDKAVMRTPEQAARILKLEMQTGLPGDFIESDIDNIEREASSQTFDPDVFRRSNPKFTQWLASNPNHYALAKDDLNIFQRIGRMGSSFMGGVSRASLQDQIGELEYKDLEGSLSPTEQAQYSKLRADMESLELDSKRDMTESYVARQSGYGFRQFGTSLKNWATGAAVGGGAALVAGQLGPQVGLPEELVTVPTGMFAGGLSANAIYTYKMESGSAYQQFKNMKDIDGKTIDPAVAKSVARGVGAINAVIETGTDAAIASLIPGFKQLTGGLLGKPAKDAVMANVKKALAVPGVRDTVIKALGKLTTASALEGFEELSQAFAQVAGRETAQGASGQMFLPDDLGQDLTDAAIQARDAAVSTAFGPGLLFGGVEFHSRLRQVKKAQESEQFYMALGEGVTESKTFQNLPEKGQELVAALVKDGPYEKTYIEPKVWQEYWQSKNIDPREVAAEVLGNYEAYDDAVAAGHDIAIPTERYARKIAPTEHNKFFAQEVRRSPDEMNARESREFFQKMEEEQAAQKEQAQQIAQEEMVAEKAKSVADIVREQLKAAGLSETVAEPDAKLVEAFFKTVGQRAGIDPVELFNRYGLTIQGEQAAQPMAMAGQVMEQSGIDQTQTPEFKKWFGDSKVVDSKGKPLVVYHGTDKKFKKFKTPAYFSSQSGASPYGRNVMPAYLSLKNPKIIDYMGGQDNDVDAFEIEDAINEGYDGLIIKNVDDGYSVNDQYIAFSPEQIRRSTILNQSPIDQVAQFKQAESLEELQKTVPEAKTIFDTPEVLALRKANAEKEETVNINTPERQAMRERIAEELYKKNIENRRRENKVFIVIGGPASGKGAISGALVEKYGALEIDNDLAKKALQPEYGPNGEGASIVHKEASDISDGLVLKKAALAGDNIVWVKVGKNATDMKAAVKAFKQAGYEVNLVLVELDPNKATPRALHRHFNKKEQGFVDPSYIIHDVGLTPTAVYDTLKSEVNAYVRFNNDVQYKEAPRLVEQKGDFLTVDDVKGFSERRLQREASDSNAQGSSQGKEGQVLEQEARGRISFGFGPDRRFNIELFKHADRSTLLHELGHFYLEVIGDLATSENAPQQIKDDYRTILKWFGVESRDQVKTKQHEQFARGFEAYLMEGKAPTASLRAAFARFKTWLTKIYRELRNLNVELNDDVRAVFDRLLATEDEIAATQAELKQEPLFVDPVAFGMNEAQAARYLQAREEARIAAEEYLAGKMMAELNRAQTEWWQEQRAKIRAEVAEEVGKERIYVALFALQKGTRPDGSAYPESVYGVFPQKLSKEGIIELTDKNFLKRLPRPYVYTAKDGIHPALAAELYGYPSPRTFFEELATAEKFDDKVERLTDERMKALHGDMLTDQVALKEEALKAVHNDKRAEVMRLELEFLAKQDMPAFKDIIRRTTRRMPRSEEVRFWAENVIARLPVKEIRPIVYQRAEIKAAGEAGQFLAKGDIDAAFDAKLRELRNHELYRIAVEARETVSDFVSEFRKVFKSDEKLSKTRDMDLVNAARAVLAQFGLGKTDKAPSAYIEPIKRYDPEMYETINDIVSKATEGAANYRDVSYDDFVAMKESVESLWTLSLRTQQLTIDGKLMDRETVMGELSGRLADLIKPGNRAGYDRAVTKWDRAKIGLMGIRASLRRVESWVEAMDGSESGVFRRYIWNPISEAVNHYRESKKNYLQKYLELVKGIEKSLVKKEIAAPELGYTFSGKAELLHALLHTGNESNLAKLLRGREWGTYDEEGNLDTGRWDSFVARLWNEGVLTKEDYDFVQGVWDLLEELKPAAQKAHKDMYGYYFNEITANEIQTPWGKYRGGYVPAIADPFIAQDAAIRQEKESLEKSNNSFMFPTAGRGFTKGRVEAYARPLALDLRYIPSHIDKVLRFTHIEPRVKDVGRIVMDREFRKQLDTFDPTVGGDMLVPWLQRAAQQMVETPSKGWGGKAADWFFKELRRRSGLQIMVANVVNTLQQVTGLSMAAVKVKPKYLRNALWVYTRHPHQLAADVSEKSVFMRNRTTTQVMEIQNTIDDLVLNQGKYEKAVDFAKKHGYFMQQGMQNVVDVITWSGAYDQAVANGATEIEAVRAADSAVRETQGSFSPEDVSRFETGSPFMRAFTMFYSYFNMQANLLGTEFIKITRDIGLRKGTSRALYIYVFAFMIPAVLSELIVRAASGEDIDDDDDGYLDDIFAIFFGSQIRTAAAMVPVLGPATMAGINATNDKWYDDRISTSPAISMLESAIVGNAKTAWRMIEGKEINTGKSIRDALTAVGLLTGIPLGWLGRPAGYLADVEQGKANPDGAADYARGLITGKRGD